MIAQRYSSDRERQSEPKTLVPPRFGEERLSIFSLPVSQQQCARARPIGAIAPPIAVICTVFAPTADTWIYE
jgi:hypothetical protein